MKKFFKEMWIPLLIPLAFLFFTIPVFALDTLYQYFDGSAVATGSAWGCTAYKEAVTFTTTDAYSITSVSVKLYRTGVLDTTMLVAIYDTTTGTPDVLLTSESVDVTGITTSTAGEWYNYIFTTPVDLSASTIYTIVLTGGCGGDGSTAYVRWKFSNTEGSLGQEQWYKAGADPWTREDPTNHLNVGFFKTYGLPVSGGSSGTGTTTDSITYHDWLFVTGVQTFLISFIAVGLLFSILKTK